MGLRNAYLVLTFADVALSADHYVIPVLVGFMAVPCREEVSSSFGFALHVRLDIFWIWARAT